MINLTASEILMLHYAPNFHAGDNDFQKFWEFKYNIDPRATLNKLYLYGYIEYADTKHSLSKMKLNELKIILSDNGLKVSGKKDELIERIIENLNENTLKKYCRQQYYKLTQIGMDVLQENPNILFAHRHPEFELDINNIPPSGDIYEYISYKTKSDEEEYFYYNNWGLYRNSKLKQAQIAEQTTDLLSAISLYIEICYIDISGLRNGVEAQRLYELKEYILNAWGDPTRILAGGIVEKIRFLSKNMDLNYNDVSTMVHSVINKTTLPFHLYSKDDAANIILRRLYGTLRTDLSTEI